MPKPLNRSSNSIIV